MDISLEIHDDDATTSTYVGTLGCVNDNSTEVSPVLEESWAGSGSTMPCRYQHGHENVVHRK